MQEARILTEAQRGDTEAFEQLVAPYERRLYAVCLRMMPSPQDAQDALQDTMLRIWRGLRAFDARAQFSTWAYRVATSACLDALRRQKSRATASLDALQDQGLTLEDPAETPEQALLTDARAQAVQHALTELEPEARAVLVLRDIQGEPYEQVAAALGLSLGTVKSRLHRAREKLAKQLRSKPELFELDRVQTNVQASERRRS